MQHHNESSKKLISILVPVHNEEKNIPLIHEHLARVCDTIPSYSFEMIFVNDGSTDSSALILENLAALNPSVRVIEFSRNFGKESATSAAIHASHGDAAIAIDADLQHPPELIPLFIQKWEAGAEVVVGVRNENKSDSLVKKIGSRGFYMIMKSISDVPIIPQATDFRLIDRTVIDAFTELTERSRMTRGLIDWLGFRRAYVHFDPADRAHGEASYGFGKLVKLALTTFISHSFFPLRIAGYLGIAITIASGVLGMVMLLDRYAMYGWGFNFSGPAILATVILFLVGIILICIGLLAFYIGHIYIEAQNRPLYVIKKKKTYHLSNSNK